MIGAFAGLIVCIFTAASEKGFAFAVREGRPRACLGTDKVLEQLQPGPLRAGSRALRSIAPEAGLECSSSDEDEASLATKGESRELP